MDRFLLLHHANRMVYMVRSLWYTEKEVQRFWDHLILDRFFTNACDLFAWSLNLVEARLSFLFLNDKKIITKRYLFIL